MRPPITPRCADARVGRRFELVKSWMAHHQGMSLLVHRQLLNDGVVQHWFHGDPGVQATELLLHERPIVKKRAASLLRWPALSFRNGGKREEDRLAR